MPELASMLMRRSLGAVTPASGHCASCRRTPLAGERLHELEGGRVVCDLCLAGLPEKDRTAVRSERIHVSDRPLAVVPRAAAA